MNLDNNRLIVHSESVILLRNFNPASVFPKET
jgi:hypothetical protein